MIGKFMGIFAIIPMTMILAVSFFVMAVARRAEDKGLQSFGRIVVLLLWLSATMVFATGLYGISSGRCPLVKKLGKCGIDRKSKKNA
jgi:hypothetical protein